MSEYVCEIRIYRPSRGEGDVPLLVTAGSGTAFLERQSKQEALLAALEKASDVVKAAIGAIET